MKEGYGLFKLAKKTNRSFPTEKDILCKYLKCSYKCSLYKSLEKSKVLASTTLTNKVFQSYDLKNSLNRGTTFLTSATTNNLDNSASLKKVQTFGIQPPQVHEALTQSTMEYHNLEV